MAILDACEKADDEILDICRSGYKKLDISGSCALMVILIESRCFVVNVGDSRALLSSNKGDLIIPLSEIHRPSN